VYLPTRSVPSISSNNTIQRARPYRTPMFFALLLLLLPFFSSLRWSGGESTITALCRQTFPAESKHYARKKFARVLNTLCRDCDIYIPPRRTKSQVGKKGPYQFLEHSYGERVQSSRHRTACQTSCIDAP